MTGAKTTAGIIILLGVALAYGALFVKTRPILSDNQANPSPDVSSAITSKELFAKLRARDVNGNLPVSVKPDETHQGEARNPFIAP